MIRSYTSNWPWTHSTLNASHFSENELSHVEVWYLPQDLLDLIDPKRSHRLIIVEKHEFDHSFRSSSESSYSKKINDESLENRYNKDNINNINNQEQDNDDIEDKKNNNNILNNSKRTTPVKLAMKYKSQYLLIRNTILKLFHDNSKQYLSLENVFYHFNLYFPSTTTGLSSPASSSLSHSNTLNPNHIVNNNQINNAIINIDTLNFSPSTTTSSSTRQRASQRIASKPPSASSYQQDHHQKNSNAVKLNLDLDLTQKMILTTFEFLHRMRFINYGLLVPIEPLKVLKNKFMNNFNNNNQTKLFQFNTNHHQKLDFTESPDEQNRELEHQNNELNSSERKQKFKIIIIGAGIAGITTARELKNIYHHYPYLEQPEILILEGRDRLGGRIHSFELKTRTRRSEVNPYVDLGAQIITGLDGNPLKTILEDQIGAKFHFLKNAQFTRLYDTEGQLISADKDFRVEKLFNQVLELACHSYVQDGKLMVNEELKLCESSLALENNKYHTGKQPSLYRAFLFHLSRHEEFSSLDATDLQMINWHLANLEFANAGTLDKVSLHHWDQDDQFGFGGYHCMPYGGYSQLPYFMAEGTIAHAGYETKVNDSLNILYNKTVKSIQWKSTTNRTSLSSLHIEESHNINSDDEQVAVVDENGEKYTADAVVITAPLGVLKSDMIDFQPSLPEWKQEAIDSLGYGVFNKVVLVFPRIFWNRTLDSFGSVGHSQGSQSLKDENRGEFFLFWNLFPITNLPALVAFSSGVPGLKMEDEDNQVIVNTAMRILKNIFSDQSIPDPVEAVITRWGKDKFSRGTYSFVANGATGQHYDDLAENVDEKLYWAGEATFRQHPATVHGAMMSGMRAARDLSFKLLGSLKF